MFVTFAERTSSIEDLRTIIGCEIPVAKCPGFLGLGRMNAASHQLVETADARVSPDMLALSWAELCAQKGEKTVRLRFSHGEEGFW